MDAQVLPVRPRTYALGLALWISDLGPGVWGLGILGVEPREGLGFRV